MAHVRKKLAFYSARCFGGFHRFDQLQFGSLPLSDLAAQLRSPLRHAQLQEFLSRSQLADSRQMRRSRKPDQTANAQAEKQGCLVQVRRQPKIERRGRRIPLPAAIVRNNPKAVAPWRDVRVIRAAPPASFDPVLIEPFQLVFENDSMG